MGLRGKVIRNFHPYKGIKKNNKKEYLLWVSTIRKWKRPKHLISLCRNFPNERFVMIGGRPNSGDRKLYDIIKEDTKQIINLEFKGYQPIETTEQYFDQCKIFINTSEYEGFPNTFLQAWRRGIPVISYIDPDGIIEKYGLGCKVSTEEEFKDRLYDMLNTKKYDKDRIIDYYNKNHSDEVIKKYSVLIEEVSTCG